MGKVNSGEESKDVLGEPDEDCLDSKAESTGHEVIDASKNVGVSEIVINKLMLSAKDAAKYIGIGRTLWYALKSEGKLPAPTQLGKRVLWRRCELQAWVEADCPDRLVWESLQAKD